MKGAVLALALAAAAGCAPVDPVEMGDLDLPRAVERPRGRSAEYELTWHGRPIGRAIETLEPTPGGHRFTRHETVAVRRSGTVVESALSISIDTDRQLRPRQVDVTSRVGATSVSGRALRDRGDWTVSWGDEPPRRIAGTAIPAELLFHQLAARGKARFSGHVFLAGYGFATARLTIEPLGRSQVVATARTELGAMTSTIDLGAGGVVERVRSSQPLATRRVRGRAVSPTFDPPEIVDTAAIPLVAAPARNSRLDARGPRPTRLVVTGARRPVPAAPGQSVSTCGDDWVVGEPPAAAPDRHSAAVARGLARRTADLLADDVDAPAASAGQALALGRGDCTSHARLFAAIARERGFQVQLVTGFRADRDRRRMVRHRWALVRSKRDADWFAVDPTWGEAPIAPGATLALAVHGDSAREIAVADELAFAGMALARAELTDRPCARSTARIRRSAR